MTYVVLMTAQNNSVEKVIQGFNTTGKFQPEIQSYI